MTPGKGGLRRLFKFTFFVKIRKSVKFHPKESTMSSAADSPSPGEGTGDARTATTLIPLDADGDLVLRARKWSFKACSATLRRASPVWKAMLFGPWKESRPTIEGEEWVVTQSEDPTSALEVVLAIVHGQFDRVPQHMELQAVSGVLMVRDKYDVSGVMGPWVKQWAEEIDWYDLPNDATTVSSEPHTLLGSWGLRTSS
jgi:hypothetical protein